MLQAHLSTVEGGAPCCYGGLLPSCIFLRQAGHFLRILPINSLSQAQPHQQPDLPQRARMERVAMAILTF